MAKLVSNLANVSAIPMVETCQTEKVRRSLLHHSTTSPNAPKLCIVHNVVPMTGDWGELFHILPTRNLNSGMLTSCALSDVKGKDNIHIRGR